MSRSFERLSSGQRINRASDDAAGLAIADSLKATGRVYAQAVRNGNDGISLLNIADSAISELSSIVVRIKELSEQSANGTYSNKQREALDLEAQQLSQEFTRITKTTSFNGMNLFSGSGVVLQMGNGIEGTLKVSIGSDVVGTGEFAETKIDTSYSNTNYALTLGDLNGDGIQDLLTAGTDNKVEIRLGNGDGSFGAASIYSFGTFALTYYEVKEVSLGDLNGDGRLDLVVSAHSGDGMSGQVTIALGNGDGTFASATSYSMASGYKTAMGLGDFDGDGVLDLFTAGYGTGHNNLEIRLGHGDGSFGAATVYTLDILHGSYDTVREISIGDLNGDGILDLVTTIGSSGSGQITTHLGNGSAFTIAETYAISDAEHSSLSLGDINGDGLLDLLAASVVPSYRNNEIEIRLGQGDGSFAAAEIYTSAHFSRAISVADVNGDRVLDFVAVGTDINAYEAVGVTLAKTKEGLGPLQQFSLQTEQDSRQAMNMLDETLQNLAKQRGTIGVSQSRVNIAIQNLLVAKENFAAAESRIRDVDIAEESSALIKTQILQKAATSVLAQANQQPALALQLLG